MRVLTIALVALCWCLQSTHSIAQLRGFSAPAAPREPARTGLFGGIREAREERFRREAQAAAAAARGAANPAAPNAAASNSAARNALPANPRNPNAALAPNAAQQTAAARAAEARRASLASPFSMNRNASNLPPNANGSRGNNAQQSGIANRNRPGQSDYAAASGANSESDNSTDRRASNYRGPETSDRNVPNAARQSSAVVAASADMLVPRPIPYDGPGVVIRLPAGSAAPVNYLIDDIESSTIEPGEAQTLGSKGSYVIRYSRGVTPSGKSFGESRYSVTEGQYRFELTDNGWELYREPDPATAPPPNRIEVAEESSVDALLNRLGRASGATRQLPNESLSPNAQGADGLPAESQSNPANAENQAEKQPAQPSTQEPAASVNEEVLPAPKPRSILEK